MEKEKFIEAINQKGLGNNLMSIYYNIGRALPFTAQRFPDGRVSNWYKSQYVEVHEVKPSGRSGMYGKAYGFYYRNGERADAYDNDPENSWCKKEDTEPQEIPCGSCGSWVLLDIKGEATVKPTTIYGPNDVLEGGKYEGKTVAEVIENDWHWVEWAIWKSKRFFFDAEAVYDEKYKHLKVLHPRDVLTFGKYKGMMVLEVAQIDVDYLIWIDKNSDDYLVDFNGLSFLQFVNDIIEMRHKNKQDNNIMTSLVLLLALIDAIEAGIFTGNEFVLNNWLEERYNSLISLYNKGTQLKAVDIMEPFWHLEMNNFWYLIHLSEHQTKVKTPSKIRTKEKVEFAFLNDSFWYILQEKEWRDKLRTFISNIIAATDQEIDTRVFDLYGLTEEEREIVMKN